MFAKLLPTAFGSLARYSWQDYEASHGRPRKVGESPKGRTTGGETRFSHAWMTPRGRRIFSEMLQNYSHMNYELDRFSQKCSRIIPT